ncbi:MAG: type I-B CRISPR-associated protein Cas7/Cst2/DevR [Candidatus Riflebacteria bacterium]|nr:type I-B CRISPR-associated protein Cas7/Cst2/DevR [Candidatus Riflebacteria bacterium]
MSLHVFGAIVTHHGCAANNRGESEGNITTLQKLLWKGQIHSTVSAEAIRWAVRYFWQSRSLQVNRKWVDEKDDHEWQDQTWKGWVAEKSGDAGKSGEAGKDKTFLDDDLLGYMDAKAAKEEGDADGKKNKKGSTLKRRGVLEITRAVSTTPFAGDISFNSRSGVKGRTSLYGTEMHATRYQYGFAMTPERLRVKDRCIQALDALSSLGEVAGNHSRFLYDFSPESVILRITQDPAPRLLYCFEEADGSLTASELVVKLNAGDIKPSELFIGGPIAAWEPLIKAMETEPGHLFAGVNLAFGQAKTVVQAALKLPKSAE